MGKLKEDNLYELCTELDSRKATVDELKLCHTDDYIKEVQAFKSKNMEELIQLSQNKNSVYYHWETYECACLATGCLLQVVDDVCNKKVDKCLNENLLFVNLTYFYLFQSSNGIGIVRPPGHHANAHSSSGFCFFNSIAVAAKYAQTKYESIKKYNLNFFIKLVFFLIFFINIKRVLILDYDIHHGNGTQDIFKNDDRFSL